MPMPDKTDPSLFSLFTSNWSCMLGDNQVESPSPSAARLVFNSRSDPLPGPPGSSTTCGLVLPAPIRPVLMVLGS